MGSTFDIQIRVAKGVLILNSIFAGIGFFIFNEWVPFITGILFGSIIAILNFRLLSLTLEKAVVMAPESAQKYATSRYFVRFLLYGVVIFISIKANHINVLGTILGLVSLKLVILKTELFNDFQFFKNIFKRKEGK